MMETPNKRIYIYHKDDILYDVHIVTDKIARSSLDKNIEERMQIQSSDAEPDHSILLGLLKKYAKQVVARCARYIANFTIDDKICFEMEFPYNWQDVFSVQLENAIKDFIVNSILSDYLEITDAKSSNSYKSRAFEAHELIKTCITARIAGSVFRPAQP